MRYSPSKWRDLNTHFTVVSLSANKILDETANASGSNGNDAAVQTDARFRKERDSLFVECHWENVEKHIALERTQMIIDYVESIIKDDFPSSRIDRTDINGLTIF